MLASLASAQAPGLCQLEGDLLTPNAWCESNSLANSVSELLTPADWREEATPCRARLAPRERQLELLTPPDWAFVSE
jgi:hypothetical protein